jgi:hypothetical protein
MRTIINRQGDLATITTVTTAQAFFNVRIDTEPPVRLQIAWADTIAVNNRSNRSDKELTEALLWSRLAEYGFTKQDEKR